MQRYVAGESIREIAREERRDRATVTKIVRSEEMNAFVHQMRERLYGLGCDALAAVEHELRVRTNGRLGYQLLTGIGVVPSPKEKHEIAYQPVKIDQAGLTPFEIAMAEDKNGDIDRVRYQVACVIEESSECYGTPLPTPEEIRHKRRVAEVADQITNGDFFRICFTDGAKEKRVRALADEIVRSEESQRSRLLSRAQRAFSQPSNHSLPVGEKGSSTPSRVQARFGKPAKWSPSS
jgi:hypothetical protein